jgi:hypothetical protein
MFRIAVAAAAAASTNASQAPDSQVIDIAGGELTTKK